jgi:phosphoglycolate phosphatase-like HAD superfamily hydrolase
MQRIRILNPAFRRGRVTHALFDFDGTISLIRYQWEEVMQELMEEMISGPRRRIPSGLSREVSGYINRSTGILTIRQMEWLAEAVRRWALNDSELSAKEYKRLYNEKLLERKVDGRVAELSGSGAKEDFLLEGAFGFLEKLSLSGVKLYLASGTDDVYVRREASLLGVTGFFDGGICGAMEDTEEYSKENIIRRILENELSSGSEEIMIVAGDGPVEIKAAREFGALAIGVASDEGKGRGWNPMKVERLTEAGADILIPDFSAGDRLLQLICEGR